MTEKQPPGMAEERTQRRLAAILAADVVGYSRLMGADEVGTFERLRTYRKELFEPEIEKHHGHVFKLMGDGLLAEFGSVVDAVECAVALQRGMTERNGDLPEDLQLRLCCHPWEPTKRSERRGQARIGLCRQQGSSPVARAAGRAEGRTGK
jgi:class 3 adenylate cyclase